MCWFRLHIWVPLFLALIAIVFRGVLLLVYCLYVFDQECPLLGTLPSLILDVPFEVKVKHVEDGICRERFEQIRSEVDPLVVQLLVVIGPLIVKPVPAGDNAEVEVRDRNPHHVHEDQKDQDVLLKGLTLERGLVQPDHL